MWQSVCNISERALQYLIPFLKYFLDLLGTLFDNYQLKEASKEIPLTTKTAIKLLGLCEDGIIQYVVCPTCHSIYEYEDCLTTLTNGDKASKLCCFVKYPNHTQPSRRGPCNTLKSSYLNLHFQKIQVKVLKINY